MIHLMQYLCPYGHCYAAIVWDDRGGSVDDARRQLGDLVDEVAAMHDQDLPVCHDCGSTAFGAEDSLTRYRSMMDVVPSLVIEGIRKYNATAIMCPSRN